MHVALLSSILLAPHYRNKKSCRIFIFGVGGGEMGRKLKLESKYLQKTQRLGIRFQNRDELSEDDSYTDFSLVGLTDEH